MDEAIQQDEIEPLFEDEQEKKERLSIASSYLSFLHKVRKRPVRVRLPSAIACGDSTCITEVPKIT